MALKRKLVDDASAQYQSVKQMKLVPFPSSEQNCNAEMDVDMPMVDEPLFGTNTTHTPFHSRLSSSVSTASSEYSSDSSSPSYPTFDLYPASGPISRVSPSVNGRLYTSLSFPHLKIGCKQIPKLRVACSAGPSGQHSMWGICDECGAIEMLDS